MTAIIVKFNCNQSSATSKTGEQSPWPVMFSATNNKRSLSPDHTSTELTDNNGNKKLKSVTENGTDEILSPSKTSGVFSFNAAANNSNSTDDQKSS